jgi:predicted DNA-binding protein
MAFKEKSMTFKVSKRFQDRFREVSKKTGIPMSVIFERSVIAKIEEYEKHNRYNDKD